MMFEERRLRRVEATLNRIETKLDQLLTEGEETMALIDDVLQGVKDESTLEDSVIALLQNVQAQLAASGAPPATTAQIQSILDAMNANKAKLNAALVANVTPPPAPAPVAKP